MRQLFRTTVTALIGAVLVITFGTTANADDSSGSAAVDIVRDVVGVELPGAIDHGSHTASQGLAVAARVAGVDVSIPSEPTTPVTIGDGEHKIAIGLPFSSRADDAIITASATSFDNNNESSTVAVVKKDGAVQFMTTIEGTNAPTAYEYDMDLAPGTRLVETDDGGVAIVEPGGDAIAFIEAPWATDAAGSAVATEYEIHGSTLVQIVEHDEDVAYPVVADPTYYWWGVRYTLSSYQTNKLISAMNGGGGFAALVAAICTGTVAGAIPCGAAYGVAAALLLIGAATLGWCNSRSRGIYLYAFYGATGSWCRSR